MYRILALVLSLSLCVSLSACVPAPDTTDNAAGDDNGSIDNNDNGGATGDNDNGDGGGEIVDSNPNALSLTGTILPSESAKRRARAAESDLTYTVVAQSAETMEIYRGTTDADGNFQIDLPTDEQDSLVLLTILTPEGKPAGPIVFDADAEHGFTGLDLSRDVSVGQVQIPENPAMEPILPGDDADAGDVVADDVFARLDDNGVPVGVGTYGKGEDAAGDVTTNPRQACDADQDGLPDGFDADNDGDGVVDDFDANGGDPDNGDGIRLNFFMNLKIGTEKSATYYDGSSDEIASALQEDIVITLEVIDEADDGVSITGVRCVPESSPAYLATADVNMESGGGGLLRQPWSESDYAFADFGDRWQAFIIPNATIEAGDTFTIEVSFSDDTTKQYSRMVNYVFRNIPRLIQFGADGALNDYVDQQPIEFDGTQDLVLVFEPPPDETGALLTGMSYQFEMFYLASGDGSQVEDVDFTATWPAPPANFSQNKSYNVAADALVLSGDNTFTVTIPKEVFVDQVVLNDTSTQDIGSYKIDIAAQNNGNAAIMLVFQKQ